MFTIKTLEEKDLPVFASFFARTVAEEFPEYRQKTREYFGTETYTKNQLIGRTVLGAFEGDQLVGFLVSDKPHGGILFIPWIMVTKEFQRQGIGTLLLSEIEKYALKEGAHSIHLETYLRDLEYYKKLGFSEYGFDKNSYFGVDEYLMKKDIQEPKEENFLKY